MTIDALRIHRHDALRGGLEQQPQLAIVFLVAARLERLFSLSPRGDVQLETNESSDRASGFAFDAAEALYPRHGSV